MTKHCFNLKFKKKKKKKKKTATHMGGACLYRDGRLGIWNPTAANLSGWVSSSLFAVADWKKKPIPSRDSGRFKDERWKEKGCVKNIINKIKSISHTTPPIFCYFLLNYLFWGKN